MPRVRKIECKDGLVSFGLGVTEEIIQDFLKENKIERIKDSEERITSKQDVKIQVPPADVYIVPDHIYVWLNISTSPTSII